MYIVDAFADKRFHGNPAAVCMLPSTCTLDDSTRQQIAAEMNLSETAFLERLSDRCTCNACHPACCARRQLLGSPW